ncbi:extensin family protein [Aestuariibius insulae]|uniref:extensin-like domain-containing protein n=1 Tax=Aestuariibius insulae TaxID=2058287 RepID=UPI00345E792A
MKMFRRIVVALVIVAAVSILIERLLTDPDTPLPRAWNPMEPLDVSASPNILTPLKLSRAVRMPERCYAALETSRSRFEILPDLEASNSACGISAQVRLTSVGPSLNRPLNTTCETALRLAMWAEHGLEDVIGIDHIGSYSCRAMRTSRGSAGRMSTHATAEAVDIVALRFADGRRLSLIDDWGEELQGVRDSACDWFRVVLSPDYNALHRDHFHLQNRGWELCR